MSPAERLRDPVQERLRKMEKDKPSLGIERRGKEIPTTLKERLIREILTKRIAERRTQGQTDYQERLTEQQKKMYAEEMKRRAENANVKPKLTQTQLITRGSQLARENSVFAIGYFEKSTQDYFKSRSEKQLEMERAQNNPEYVRNNRIWKIGDELRIRWKRFAEDKSISDEKFLQAFLKFGEKNPELYKASVIDYSGNIFKLRIADGEISLNITLEFNEKGILFTVGDKIYSRGNIIYDKPIITGFERILESSESSEPIRELLLRNKTFDLRVLLQYII